MMRPPGSLAWVASRLRLGRHTARLRLTLLYSGLFFICGAAMVVATNILAHGYFFWKTPTIPTDPSDQGPPALHITWPSPDSAQHALDLHQLWFLSAFTLATMTVVSLILGWVVAGRVLRPLRAITTAARAISASNLHERLSMTGPDDEFKQLGDTLDELFARLEAAFEAQRHFVANASHELRTPLALEQTLLQVALADPEASAGALRATCEELLATGVEQQRLIEALLTLASSERGLEYAEPFDLATAATDALRAAKTGKEHRRLHIVTMIDPAPIMGDADLVRRLTANLIDNAVHHNIPGGRIECRTYLSQGSAVLAVANTGPVIPSAEVSRLLQPFQRLRAVRGHYRGGHGLGLSIVRAIANAHGAVLDARARPEGGLDITVRFPAATQDGQAVDGAVITNAARRGHPTARLG